MDVSEAQNLFDEKLAKLIDKCEYSSVILSAVAFQNDIREYKTQIEKLPSGKIEKLSDIYLHFHKEPDGNGIPYLLGRIIYSEGLFENYGNS